MPWVRIDDHFDEHPKMQQVGPLGWGVWLAGLAYCNRNLTDGFIPYAKARTLCSFEVVEDDGQIWELSRSSGYAGSDIESEWVINLLVDTGLWHVVENGRGRIDGYRIHDYDQYQPSREEVTREREQNAERQRRHRERKAEAAPQSNAATNNEVTPLVTRDKRSRNRPPVPNPVPVPVPEDDVPNVTSSSLAPAEPSRAVRPVPKPAKPARERNETWDAVVALCGSPATEDEESDVGKTVSQLKQANATPEQIAGFGPWWYENHADARLTHRCLRRHWGAYLTAPQRPPPSVNSIKNPVVRSALTVDLSDIRADEEAKRARRNRLSRQNDRSGDVLGDPRRLAAGE